MKGLEFMRCPKCESENVKVTAMAYTKSQRRSLLWNLFMLIITSGLWLIWMLVRRNKERVVTNTMAVCQNCGYTWET